MKIALIIGSLRKESLNRKMAENLKSIAPKTWEIQEVTIDDLPLYNQDFDEQTIDSYERVRKQIKAAEAVIFVTPEHNRSLPAALKNVFDIATRPAGNNLWAGKKAGIVTVTTGGWGANLAALELQKIGFMMGMSFSTTMANFSHGDSLFDDNGKLTDDKAQQFLHQFASSFDKFIDNQA